MEAGSLQAKKHNPDNDVQTRIKIIARRAENRKAPLSKYENTVLQPANQRVIFINTKSDAY